MTNSVDKKNLLTKVTQDKLWEWRDKHCLQYYDNTHVFVKDLLLVWLCEERTVARSLSCGLFNSPSAIMSLSKGYVSVGGRRRCKTLVEPSWLCVSVGVCVCVCVPCCVFLRTGISTWRESYTCRTDLCTALTGEFSWNNPGHTTQSFVVCTKCQELSGLQPHWQLKTYAPHAFTFIYRMLCGHAASVFFYPNHLGTAVLTHIAWRFLSILNVFRGSWGGDISLLSPVSRGFVAVSVNMSRVTECE